MNKLAPIVLFVYNRPYHTAAVLNALAANKISVESDLFVFCDGAKENASDELLKQIKEVESIVDKESRFKKVNVIKSEVNKGLANSIIDGVTKIVNEYGKIIVLEDDLLVSGDFLEYMNAALQKYEASDNVACITGYVYPLKSNLQEAFFLKGADCWTWGTWSSKWKYFNTDAKQLLITINNKRLTKEFNFGNSYPYLQMLEERDQGKNQSWAILWYASAFIHNLYCLYPPVSLVKNIGNDGSGTHFTTNFNFFNTELKENLIIKLPDSVVENTEARKLFEQFFTLSKVSIPKRIYRKVKRILSNLIPKKINEGWQGNYSSWVNAMKECTGYDELEIPAKIKQAVLKVKSGEAKYERDSVTFDELYLYQPVVDALTASINNGKLHVCDFGGSLGSSYFQHRHLFSSLSDFKWTVVEQKHFVSIGNAEIAEKELSFCFTIEEALKHQSNQVLVLSSVLQYLPEPYVLIEKLMDYNFEFILIDRTAFVQGNKERLTKQIVPEYIYKATYPAWFFNEEKFKNAFTSKYQFVSQFVNDIPMPMKIDDDNVYWKGFYLKRKNG